MFMSFLAPPLARASRSCRTEENNVACTSYKLPPATKRGKVKSIDTLARASRSCRTV